MAKPSPRSWIALFVAITAWSLSPVLIVQATGLASAPVVALYAVVLGSGIALLASSVSRRLNIITTVRELYRSKLLIKSAAVGLMAFVAYPVLYFSAIQSGPPLLVNLVNYLWPIVGLVIVSAARHEGRSLELLLAGGFGFAGAMLAILGRASGGNPLGDIGKFYPFLLAALGALAYGAVSAFMNITAPDERGGGRLGFLLFALVVGGLSCLAVLGVMAVIDTGLVMPHYEPKRVWALLLYSALLPVAHLSWLTAVQNKRIPGFTATFLVPVLATIVLAIAGFGQVGPEILSALLLVLCGIVFSTARGTGIPVAFAVTLAALGSIQVSEALPAGSPDQLIDVSGFSEILVGLVAIFGGFVLTNAISRYRRLQEACAGFYLHAAFLLPGDPQGISQELNALDGHVLHSGTRQAQLTIARNRAELDLQNGNLTREWVWVNLALGNGVSRYEWLVLMLGGSGVILSLHFMGIGQSSPLVLVLRAVATAVVVGVLFAIRDYDHNRPDRTMDVLHSLRQHFGLPIPPDSPLANELRERQEERDTWPSKVLLLLVIGGIISIILTAR